MLAEVANDQLRLLKVRPPSPSVSACNPPADPPPSPTQVPDGLMMDHGGPPAVKQWIEEQVRSNTFTPTER